MVGVLSPSLPDNKNTQPYLHISSKLTHGMNAPSAGLRWRWRRAKQAVTATPHELRLKHVALPSACRSALSHRRRRFYPIGARPQRGPTLQPAQLPGQGSIIRLDEAVAAHTALMPNHQADTTCEIQGRQSTVIRASYPSRPFESAIRVSLRAAKSAIRRIRVSPAARIKCLLVPSLPCRTRIVVGVESKTCQCCTAGLRAAYGSVAAVGALSATRRGRRDGQTRL